MRIAMIGAGYVGLVSNARLVDFGHEVVCVDTDERKMAALRASRVPIYEPGPQRIGAGQPGCASPVLHDKPQGVNRHPKLTRDWSAPLGVDSFRRGV